MMYPPYIYEYTKIIIWSTTYFRANWPQLRSAAEKTSSSKREAEPWLFKIHEWNRSVRSVEARMWNPSYPLPTLSHGWAGFWESLRSRFLRRDAWSVVRSFRCFGNEVYPPVRGEVSKQTWNCPKPDSLTFLLRLLFAYAKVLRAWRCPGTFLERWTNPKCPSRFVAGQIDALFGLSLLLPVRANYPRAVCSFLLGIVYRQFTCYETLPKTGSKGKF